MYLFNVKCDTSVSVISLIFSSIESVIPLWYELFCDVHIFHNYNTGICSRGINILLCLVNKQIHTQQQVLFFSALSAVTLVQTTTGFMVLTKWQTTAVLTSSCFIPLILSTRQSNKYHILLSFGMNHQPSALWAYAPLTWPEAVQVLEWAENWPYVFWDTSIKNK